MPYEIGRKQKSAICNKANGTWKALLNCAWLKTKPDTYADSIAEDRAIVNPFARKLAFSMGIYLHSYFKNRRFAVGMEIRI